MCFDPYHYLDQCEANEWAATCGSANEARLPGAHCIGCECGVFKTNLRSPGAQQPSKIYKIVEPKHDPKREEERERGSQQREVTRTPTTTPGEGARRP